MKRKAGFTLVELLIVISLVALIGMALFAMFSSAMGMMRRISGSEFSEDAGIFLEKLDREIASQVTFRGIPFDGKETSISFPSRIDPDKKDPLNRGIGRVSYFLDDSHHVLARKQENLSQVYKPEEEGALPSLKGVTDLRFQYFVYFKTERVFQWVKEWNSTEHQGEIPFAVKVEFECAQGEERYAFERTIAVSIAEATR